MSETKVLIGVPTAEMARNASWYDYFNSIEKPAGTAITFAHGQSPARNRNLIIQQALQHGCTHVLFIDDDVVPHPLILSKLIKHDKDIVTGLYLMRNYPHQPIIFDHADAQGKCAYHYLNDNEQGLIEIVACGLGAALIKIEVFRKMSALGLATDPYNIEDKWVRLGELETDHWCDDIGFFRRVRQAGFKLYCDLSVLCGHMAQVTVWPNLVDGKWHTTYYTAGTGQVTFPAINLQQQHNDLVMK